MSIQARRRWPSILVIVAASLFAALAAAEDVRIRGTVANVRAEGSSQGKVLFQVKAGDVLRLLDVAGDWLHVETADGRRGYVSKTRGRGDLKGAARRRPPRRPPSSARAAASAPSPSTTRKSAAWSATATPGWTPASSPPESWATRRSSSAPGTGPWYAVDLMAEGACHVAYLPKPLADDDRDRVLRDRGGQVLQRAPAAGNGAGDAPTRRGSCATRETATASSAVAASVKKVAKPIVVAAAGRKGPRPRPSARSSSASARRAWCWPARRWPEREQERQERRRRGPGRGARAGGSERPPWPSPGARWWPACSWPWPRAAAARRRPPATRATSSPSPRTPRGPRRPDLLPHGGHQCSGGRTLRVCVGGLCTNSCSAFYLLSDSRRFNCSPLPNCDGTGGPIDDPNFCLTAAQQAAQACN